MRERVGCYEVGVRQERLRECEEKGLGQGQGQGQSQRQRQTQTQTQTQGWREGGMEGVRKEALNYVTF